MFDSAYDLAQSHVPVESGHFVSQRVVDEIEAIHNYFDDIEVQWIPPDKRINPTSPAFAITCTPAGGKPYIVFYVKDESEFDGRVFKKILMNDSNKNPHTTLSELEAHEATQAALISQRYKERMEEAHDIAHHALRSPLHTYKIDKNLVIKDDGRYGNGAI